MIMNNSLYAAALRRVINAHTESSEVERLRIEKSIQVALDLIAALTSLKTRAFEVNKSTNGEWRFTGAISKEDGKIAFTTIKNKSPEQLIEDVANWATEFIIG